MPKNTSLVSWSSRTVHKMSEMLPQELGADLITLSAELPVMVTVCSCALVLHKGSLT